MYVPVAKFRHIWNGAQRAQFIPSRTWRPKKIGKYARTLSVVYIFKTPPFVWKVMCTFNSSHKPIAYVLFTLKFISIFIRYSDTSNYAFYYIFMRHELCYRIHTYFKPKYYVELNAKLYFSLCSIFRRCFHIKPFLARQFNKTIEYSHAHSSFAPQRTHPSASINICLALFCIKAPMIIIINFGLLFMLPWHGDCGVIR